METPESLKDELGRWNNGAGISLEAWTACTGSLALAVGYLTVFWPEFVEHEGYILRKGFDEESLRGFERGGAASRKSVEWVMNHVHVGDLHHSGDDTVSEDKVRILGRALKEIYQAKLARDFPHVPCIVEFYEPEADGDPIDSQISFWQARQEVAD